MKRWIVSVALLVALPGLPAGAQEVEQREGWRFQVTPHGWVPSLSGTIRPRQGLPTFHTSLSGEDILSRI